VDSQASSIAINSSSAFERQFRARRACEPIKKKYKTYTHFDPFSKKSLYIYQLKHDFFEIHNGWDENWPSKGATEEPSRFWMVVESREMLANPEPGENEPTEPALLVHKMNRSQECYNMCWSSEVRTIIQKTMPASEIMQVKAKKLHPSTLIIGYGQ
jgi:hypothetical protein